MRVATVVLVGVVLMACSPNQNSGPLDSTAEVSSDHGTSSPDGLGRSDKASDLPFHTPEGTFETADTSHVVPDVNDTIQAQDRAYALPDTGESGDTLDIADLVDDNGGPFPDSPDAAEDQGETFTDTQSPVYYPSYHPDGACGMQPYQWLPPEEVGNIVEYSEQLLYHLPAELLIQMIHEAGYPLDLPFVYGTRVFAVRYITQDRGVAREATAMVGIPELPEGDTEIPAFPTALFLHGTTGFTDKCAPSKGLEGAAAALLPAAMGFIGVAPDYLGMCGFGEPCGDLPHPYLIGEATAIASLDAVRAAVRLVEDNVDTLHVLPDYRLVPWGGSQGGHAALFVDRLAPHYAPEFDVPCVIALVPPADLAAQAGVALQQLGSAASLGTGFLAAAYLWYQPDTPASALFNPDGPKDYSEYVLETFLTTCSSNALVKGSSSLYDVYTGSFLEAVMQEGLDAVWPWGCFATQNSLTTTPIPKAGDALVYYVIAENDNIVNNQVARQTFLDMCQQGYSMEFVECKQLGHTDAAVQSILMQVDWANACLSSDAPAADQLCVLKEPVDCIAW